MATITFPTTAMWVFNPTYIKITGSSASTVTITVGSYSMSVQLYGGSANVLINRLAQLNFTDPETTRSMILTMSVSDGESASASVLAIWGAVGLGDLYYQFADDGVRRVQNFTHFPFTLDQLTTSGFTNKTVSGSLDETNTSPAGSIRTIVETRSETEGVYLRWIDRFGFIQYYLFSSGEIDIKTTLSSYNLDTLRSIIGTGYARYTRPLNVETSKTFKVSAINLDRETLAYVSSIVGSPIVDLYIDSTHWLPVSIASGSYKYSQHHLKHLQDFEISIELPQQLSQSL